MEIFIFCAVFVWDETYTEIMRLIDILWYPGSKKSSCVCQLGNIRLCLMVPTWARYNAKKGYLEIYGNLSPIAGCNI